MFVEAIEHSSIICLFLVVFVCKLLHVLIRLAATCCLPYIKPAVFVYCTSS